MSAFTDALGWYPGVEFDGAGLFFRDVDASTVIPSRGNETYSTRVVDSDGNPVPDLYGAIDLRRRRTTSAPATPVTRASSSA